MLMMLKKMTNMMVMVNMAIIMMAMSLMSGKVADVPMTLIQTWC